MRVKLEYVCERGSSNLKQSDVVYSTGKYPVYGAAGHIGNVGFYHQEKPYVAVVKDGAGIGRTTICPAYSSVIGTMQYLLPKENVLPEYLCYVVRYMHLEKYFTGATIPHIYFKDYKNEQFNLDTLDKQEEIIDILGKCERIIAEKEREKLKLDNLIKARFVEMFGDPVRNHKGWNQSKLRDVSNGKLSYGSGASAIDFDGDCRYIRITDITDKGDLGKEVKSPNTYDEKYILNDGDILFARSGATVGKTFCYNKLKHGKSIFAGYLIRMIPDTNRVIPTYVYYYTKTDYYASFVNKVQRSVAQPNINAQEYGDLIICVPPIEFQNRFSEFVQQVDKSKFIYRYAIK